MEIDKLEVAKEKIRSQVDENILLILPKMLDELKHEARECQSNSYKVQKH